MPANNIGKKKKKKKGKKKKNTRKRFLGKKLFFLGRLEIIEIYHSLDYPNFSIQRDMNE